MWQQIRLNNHKKRHQTRGNLVALPASPYAKAS